MADKIDSVAVGDLFRREFLEQFQGPEGEVIRALAQAKGEMDALAYAALVEHLSSGDGADSIIARAEALAGQTAEVRGVSIGDAGGKNPDPVGSGFADLGAGNDTISARAHATTDSDDENQLFNDVDAVMLDLESELDTGSGNDKIVGHATAVDKGLGGGAIGEVGLSAVVADGVENRGTLRTGAGDDVIRGTGETSSNQAFAVAGGIYNGLGSTQNNVPVAPLLETGRGADQLIGTAMSDAVGADAFAGGIENFGKIVTGASGDTLMARAKSVLTEGEAGDLANADSIDNRTLGDDENDSFFESSGIIDTGSGDDVIDARVSARAEGGNADAIGIRNDLGFEAENQILLGGGDDKMFGAAKAVATDGNATATGISGGTVETGAGVDKLTGVANASGAEDTGATGVLFVDARTGQGADVITGRATVTGVGTADVFGIAADARGISVGLSNIDDDSLLNPNNPDAPLARAGALRTGDGDDHIIGRAHTTADVGEAEELFFANATAFTNDSGTLEDLAPHVDLKLLADAVDPEVEVSEEDLKTLTDLINAALPNLDTGDVDLGAGNDMIDVAASITVNGGQQGGQGGDKDLEVFVEGVENSGEFLTGDGNDSIVANVSGTSVGGAKILVEGIDNSGVGVSTGLNLPDQVNDLTLLDMGDGNDSITVTTRVRGEGDFAAGDGIDTRSNLVMGAGDDTITLDIKSEFVRTPDAPGDQEEGIADGIENRGVVDLGSGNDMIKADVQAKGNGILTIAEGVESRKEFHTGSGNDHLDLTARAITRAVDLDPKQTGDEVDVRDGNLTQAAGLQTEQITSGTFTMGAGHDTVIGRGTADSDGVTNNKATLAFGITQVTGDAFDEDGAGLIDTGIGSDTLEGHATAIGEVDVQAYGTLFTNGVTGAGGDTVTGNATAVGGTLAQAFGVAVGVSDNVPDLDGDPMTVRESPLVDEAGTLDTGSGNDTITGTAHATTANEGEVLFIDADAVLVDAPPVDPGSPLETNSDSEPKSELKTGAGDDVITGHASASNEAIEGIGGAFGSSVVADGVENRDFLNTGTGADVIEGRGVTRSNQAFSVAGGIDNGLGSNRNFLVPDFELISPELETGEGADVLKGSAVSTAVGDKAFAGGIENGGTILTGGDRDVLEARARSLLTDGKAGDFANADGIDNRGLLNTGSGNDYLDARVSARAEGGDADAVGIRNDLGFQILTDRGLQAVEVDNKIDLGSGNDEMVGAATAEATRGDAFAVGISGGTVLAGSGTDELAGVANATGTKDVDATGVLFVDADTGAGDDTVTGRAEAGGRKLADAFGISVGASDNSQLQDEVGELLTGAGADTLTGVAEAHARKANAYGVFVAEDSTIDTGIGEDVVRGRADATGRKAEAFGVYVSEGGTIDTSAGADTVVGFAPPRRFRRPEFRDRRNRHDRHRQRCRHRAGVQLRRRRPGPHRQRRGPCCRLRRGHPGRRCRS